MLWSRLTRFSTPYLLGMLSLFAISAASCTGDKLSGKGLLEETADPTQIPIEKVAICVWDEAGLRAETHSKRNTLKGKSNYLATIYYGEKVEIVDPQAEAVVSENRSWIKVRLKDGQEGWVNEYLFEKNARLGVMTGPAEMYRRPDLMTLRDEKVEAGDIVVVMENQTDWVHVSGREKRKKGWLRLEGNLSLNMKDVKAALLMYKSKQERDPAKRIEKLTHILEDKELTGNALQPAIESAIEKIRQEAPGSVLPSEKLFVTHPQINFYSQPIDEQGYIKRQLKQGEVCEVISKGERTTIGEMYDYWYKVRSGTDEGWVYGYFTSMRSLD
ncbi:MAG: hypothetical protein EAZ89_06735 [Bacteroidetes bacterium]|jgi:Bacterial SH3 domain|nr:MAG: hypothetical protein EAZ89_06735 [Bacteroidota bacterium]